MEINNYNPDGLISSKGPGIVMLNGLKTNNVSLSVARNILISLQIMREKKAIQMYNESI